MVKVLIAHDRRPVLDIIRQVVEAQGVQPHMIQEAEDGDTVRQRLAADLFDLAIVDLTLPPVKGKSNPSYSTAEDIFVELFRGVGLQVPGDIIGVTADTEALTKIDTTIGGHLMAVVEETEGDQWRSQLADRVSYTIRSASSRLLSASKRYDYDAAVITALDEEHAPFREIFDLKEVDHFPGATEFVFRDSTNAIRRGICYSVGSAGQAGCASATQAIIARFRPKAFFLSGFCGGYKEKTLPGEALLFRVVYDWDSGKWAAPERAADKKSSESSSAKSEEGEAVFFPRTEPVGIEGGESERVVRTFGHVTLNGIGELERQVRLLSDGEVTSIKVTPVLAASGSAVIANSAVLSKIRTQHDKIVAVDMECYGFYRACVSTPSAKPQMLCIKTVADFCDGEKHDRLHASSSFTSAKIVADILQSRWRF